MEARWCCPTLCDMTAHSPEETHALLAQATFALQPRAQIDVIEKLQSDGLALTHARWSIVGTDGEGQSPPAEWRRDDRLAAAAGGRLSGFLSESERLRGR